MSFVVTFSFNVDFSFSSNTKLSCGCVVIGNRDRSTVQSAKIPISEGKVLPLRSFFGFFSFYSLSMFHVLLDSSGELIMMTQI